MAKPTYEELEQRVKELEKEAAERKREALKDSTRLKQSEGAFQASEERLDAMLSSIGDHMSMMDKDLNIIWANETAKKIFGNDSIGKKCFEAYHKRKEPCEPHPCLTLKAFQDGKVHEHDTQVIDKNGETIYFHCTANVALRDKQGNPMAVIEISRDVTDAKRAEEALRLSEARLRAAIDSLPFDFFMLNENGRYVMQSAGSLPHWGDIRGKRPADLAPDESTLALWEENNRRAFAGEIVTGEAEFKAPKESRFFYNIISPVRDGERIRGILGVNIDITERKQAEEERKKLEATLQESQKMEAIGTLAGGIAHDFNNLLTAIQGNASLMLFDVDSTHPHYELLQTITKQVRRGANLTGQLLGYASKGRYEVKPISLNRIVEETSYTFGRTHKEITIHRELTEDLSSIEADQSQIEQVLLNLYINASGAMPRGGALTLKTVNVTHNDIKDIAHNLGSGSYVLLTVTDTGTGIDKETQERIFDPFFTTKEMGRGTGLGLASAYGIIKGHRGYIHVDSKKGSGTTFSIYLPASDKKVETVVKAAEQIVKGSGTILLVDDEDPVLDIGVMMLEKIGYTVLEAKGGREAVEIYEANKDKIDLVILDMIMPDMGGGETYDRMKEINPDVKVLLSSGYSIEGEATEILERGCDGFIQKPFNLRDLSAKIREFLDKE
jgi:two-component system cell cycle sensor histidine kinase/response regulator CckA